MTRSQRPNLAKIGRFKARLQARHVPMWATTAALGVLGGLLAVTLFGQVHTNIGPFDTTFSARPSLSGSTEVDLSPLGTLSLNTHDGPTQLDVQVDRIDLPRAKQLLDDPGAVTALEATVSDSTRAAVEDLVKRSLWLAFVGGAVLALVRRPHWRNALAGGLVSLVTVGASYGVAAGTINTNALAEPRYSGVLALAPQAIGDVRNVTNKFSLYRNQVSELVSNLSRLYETANATSTVNINSNSVRILHVSDLHLNPAGFDLVEQMVQQFKPAAIIDTGDINDWGTSFENNFASRIASLGVPYIYIRGNHDSLDTQASVAAQPNAIVLDNGTTEIEGLRIWGIGDPRFTADKSVAEGSADELKQATAAAPDVLAKFLANEPPTIDIALVHDPSTASELGGQVPLVLAGHRHRFDVSKLGNTDLLIEGSTGGAGLRGVTTEGNAVPLECSMLYFDRTTHRLTAYDHVTVEGLGGSGAQIDRRIVPASDESDGTTTTTSTTVGSP